MLVSNLYEEEHRDLQETWLTQHFPDLYVQRAYGLRNISQDSNPWEPGAASGTV